MAEDTQDGSGVQDVEQLAQQAAQAARQAAQQAEQAVQAAQQAARGVGSETTASTIETEVTPAQIGRAWSSNNKRTYDEFQDISLTAARRSQQEYDSLRNVSLQALQNAVETANMVGKQSLRHGDLSVDRQWAGTDMEEGAVAGAILRGLARLAAGEPEDVVDES